MKGLETLNIEPRPIQELINDQSDRWEYLLASQLIKVRMLDINMKYAALADESAQSEKKSLEVDDFLAWIVDTTKHFESILGWLEKLLGIDVQESLGFSGREADASELQAIANQIAATFEGLLTWERESRKIIPPSEFEDAVEILQGWTVVFLDTVNDFVQKWEHGFRQPLNEHGKLVVDVSIKINPPLRSAKIHGMVERYIAHGRPRPYTSGGVSERHQEQLLSQEQVIKDLTSLCFTAVDFEIANPQRGSLCAIGVAVVENGAIVKVWKQLVQPPELRVDKKNYAIHKISEADLETAPTFPEVWDTFRTMIEERVIVAHNAEFDMNVLQRTLELYGLEPPAYRSLCTSKLSQIAFPQLDDYRLRDVCRFLGLEFIHHSCDEDARVCAEIAIQAIPRVSLKKLDLNGHDLTHSLLKMPSKTKVTGRGASFVDKRFDSSLLKPQLKGANPDHEFYNKRLVFTGDLRSMQRSDAAKHVSAFGADINTSISKKTQIVIIGEGAGPSKMKKIQELREQGIEIRLIDEDEFLRIIKA